MTRSAQTLEAVTCISNSDKSRKRYKTSRDIVDLDDAISMLRRAVELVADDNPNLPNMLTRLGRLLANRYKRLAEIDDLKSAISAFEKAVQLTTSSLTFETDSEMPARLNVLGMSLNDCFELLEDLDDFSDSISIQRRAIELIPERRSDMPDWLNNIGTRLHKRCGRLVEVDDLDNALSTQRRAVELTSNDRIGTPMHLQNLSTSLISRFQWLGELEKVENTISAGYRAVELRPEDDPSMLMWLESIGTHLLIRFDSFGGLDDLEKAVSTQRRALKRTPEDNPDMPRRLGNLAISLLRRFERLGEVDDIDIAISLQRRAIHLTPEGHPDMVERLGILGGLLGARFMRLGEHEDLYGAIVMQHRAVELASEDHPEMPTLLANLGSFLSSRFERIGELSDLEGAISLQRRALKLTPKGHPDTPKQLNNLANSLFIRYEHLGELEDLRGSFSVQRQAVKLTPEGHPRMCEWLHSLGACLSVYFRLRNCQPIFQLAVDHYRAAFMQTEGPSSDRLKSAVSWAKLETEHPQFGSSESRLHAHACIFDVLPEMAWLGHSISRRYQESAKVAKYVGDAVCAAIELEDLRQAVEWFEAGRGLVSSLRTPVDNLAQHHPDFTKELQDLSAELRTAHLMQLHRAESSVDSFLGNESNGHRAIVIKYDDCLKRIRACAGFEHFLRPQKLVNLVSLTEHLDGPFVYINVSRLHCDAVVIFRGGAVQQVPLPDLTQGLAIQLRDSYSSYLLFSGLGQRGLILQTEAQTDKFTTILDLLWSSIVHPTLKALDLMNPNPGQLPHITWCPTGPLTQLPLHVAGFHSEPGQAGLYVYDLVVSSYAPSLSALVRDQESFARESPPPGVLIVTQPATPGLSPLPSTVTEEACLKQILSESHINGEALSGDQATVEAVQSAMARLPWVHFACHGIQDTSDPAQSAFALHDGKLTLATLMKTVAGGAELAFLSACQTATGDKEALDESAHLAAGMLAVGFKGVVGTMWSIGDADAPVVVEAYYKKLLELRNSSAVAEGSTGAAYATHEAVKALRERVGRKSFERWAPFVHYGV